MRIGVDYYPEQWPETLWENDVELMSRTGVEVVRLAEFAWCRLEPGKGSSTCVAG
jgi:beta-galactosidase